MVGRRKIILVLFGIPLFWGFFSAPALGETLTGTVVAVQDGDTFSVKNRQREVFKVRLREIDAPETSQTLGRQARQHLHDLVFGQTVKVEFDMVDRYQRRVANVTLADGRSLNEEMVRAGLAWHYRVHHPPSETLQRLEYQAWKGRVGVWVNPEVVPPWKFRREITADDPPEISTGLDYNRIFDYGLIGHVRSKTYLWPGCGNYPPPSRGYVFFAYMKQAEKAGYRPDPNCPKSESIDRKAP